MRLHRLRDDRGFTLVEFIVGAALFMLVGSTVGGFLISSLRAGAFTEGQGATINNVRNTMQSVEKEIRGADSIVWAPSGSCSSYTAGKCIVVGAQTPTGDFRTVRYSYASSTLRREIFDPDTSTWGTAITVIERVTNDDAHPLFACDTQSTLLKVTVDLYIEPTPQSNPTVNIKTSVRPRNYASAAICS